MSTIEAHIKSASDSVSQSISELADGRRLLSREVLDRLSDLVEAVIELDHAGDPQAEHDEASIDLALGDVSVRRGSNFLHRFHRLLRAESDYHALDGDAPERLMLMYYEYLCRLRDLLRDRFRIDALGNLDDFPVDQETALQEYHQKIVERLRELSAVKPTGMTSARYYIYRTRPFFVDGHTYYEVTFTQSVDRVSKFDRVIAFTHLDVGNRYAANLTLHVDSIDVLDQTMPIILIAGWEVSIRPCEIQNFAKILGSPIRASTNSNEYLGLMRFLTETGASLADLVATSDEQYHRVREQVLGQARTDTIFGVIDKARDIVSTGRPGSVILRYLLLNTRNVVLRQQYYAQGCYKLSDLKLSFGCIPFDEMPFCTSLIRHNPRFGDLIQVLNPQGREHEILARLIKNNVERRGMLYTPLEELENFPNALALIDMHNKLLYRTHTGRSLDVDDGEVFVRGYEDDTVRILEVLQASAGSGVGGWTSAVDKWLDARPGLVDDDVKAEALRALFASSRVALIYGAAGTGKSTMVNFIAGLFRDGPSLFLANTHPAVDNLRRRVETPNGKFDTIAGQIHHGRRDQEYDLVVIDECSTVSNDDLLNLLDQTRFRVLVLVGDVYQIESIQFGNWFRLASSFLPATAVFELTKPYRTKNAQLLELWQRVRTIGDNPADLDDVRERMLRGGYSTELDQSIFQKQRADEIILCLNYDGVYGINNINRFLQTSNASDPVRWGPAVYKVGDPVLFNDIDRFKPLIYNNLKGMIAGIRVQPGRISFAVTLERDVTEFSARAAGLRWVRDSTVAFDVVELVNSDDDDQNVETSVPFQVAYAVSIHKAQGLEYESVKVVITDSNQDDVSHNIFYTAVTRARERLLVYWTPETEREVLRNLEPKSNERDAALLAERRGLSIAG